MKRFAPGFGQVVLGRLPVLSLLFLSLPLLSQTNPTVSQSSPAAGITATGDFTDIPNKAQQAVAWRLTFWGPSTLTSVEMEIDCAADDGTGHPGSYSAMTGAFDSTTNPVTIAAAPFSGTIAAKQYCPHVAVNVVGLAGTGAVHFLLLGYSGTSAAASSGGGGGGCPGTSTDGQLIFNETGACAGSSAFTVDYTNGTMAIFFGPGTGLTVSGNHGGTGILSEPVDIDGANPVTGYGSEVTETDSTGSGASIYGVAVNPVLTGTNVASDSVIGLFGYPQNNGTGTLAEMSAFESNIANNGTTLNEFGFHAFTPNIVGTVTGIAAGFAADDWGLGNYAFYNSGQSLAQPEGIVTVGNVGTVPLGAFIFCSDCTAITCAGSGGGAWVFGTASGNVCPF
jgi:hypothetical protein